jgi:hypothetical protein
MSAVINASRDVYAPPDIAGLGFAFCSPPDDQQRAYTLLQKNINEGVPSNTKHIQTMTWVTKGKRI